MAKIPRSVEKGFTVVCLLISTGVLTLWRSSRPGQTEVGTDPLLQVIWMGIYAVILFLLFVLRKSAVKIIGRDKFLWLLIGVTLFSTSWSTVPMITLRRSIALMGTTLFGIYIAMRFSIEEQLRLLAWTFGIAAVLSLVVAVAMPAYGVDYAGAWQGIYNQKNVLGRLMVMSAVVFVLLALSSNKHRWIAYSLFVLSVGLVWQSTSKTALVNLVTILILLIFFRPLRLHYALAIPLSIFGILIIGSGASWLTLNWEILLASLGKNATLTGRTELWDSVLVMIGKQPLLGYGYGGFWTNGWYGPAAYVWAHNIWLPKHAHNGVLNLCLDLGLLGLTVFLLQFMMTARRAVGWIRATKTATGFWPVMYVAFVFLFNQTESSLLNQNDIFFIVYAALSVSIPIQNAQNRKTILPTVKRLEQSSSQD